MSNTYVISEIQLKNDSPRLTNGEDQSLIHDADRFLVFQLSTDLLKISIEDRGVILNCAQSSSCLASIQIFYQEFYFLNKDPSVFLPIKHPCEIFVVLKLLLTASEESARMGWNQILWEFILDPAFEGSHWIKQYAPKWFDHHYQNELRRRDEQVEKLLES